MKCKITNEKMKPFMSFGKMPLANGFLEKKDFDSEFFYEMEVGFSQKTSLFQLNDFPNPKKKHSKTNNTGRGTDGQEKKMGGPKMVPQGRPGSSKVSPS